MGLRGKQPRRKKLTTKPFSGTVPDWLSPEAVQYHVKHSQSLAESGLLTADTEDAYAVYCDLRGRLASFKGQPTSRIYLDTLGKFIQVGKIFRLLPTEQPQETAIKNEDLPAFEF